MVLKTLPKGEITSKLIETPVNPTPPDPMSNSLKRDLQDETKKQEIVQKNVQEALIKDFNYGHKAYNVDAKSMNWVSYLYSLNKNQRQNPCCFLRRQLLRLSESRSLFFLQIAPL